MQATDHRQWDSPNYGVLVRRWTSYHSIGGTAASFGKTGIARSESASLGRYQGTTVDRDLEREGNMGSWKQGCKDGELKVLKYRDAGMVNADCKMWNGRMEA